MNYIEAFNNKLHIKEILHRNIFKSKLIKIKSILSKEEGKKILKDFMPIHQECVRNGKRKKKE